MKFLIALVDPKEETATDIMAAIDEGVNAVVYMAGRTDVLIFRSLAECEKAVSDRVGRNDPPFNIIFLNTDSVPDYRFPLQKVGTFSSVVKVSKEPEMKILFQKHPPSDYLTFPIDTHLVSRIFKSCCAINRLSPEFLAIAQLKIDSKPAVMPKAPKDKQSAPGPKGRRAQPTVSRLRLGKHVTALRILQACDDLMALPLEEDCTFSSGLDTDSSQAGSIGEARVSIAEHPPYVPPISGKMIVSYNCSTLALEIVRADDKAAAVLNLDPAASSVDMKSLFGFATDHSCVHLIQHAIKHCVPAEKYITVYAAGKPVPIFLLISPVSRCAHSSGIGVAVVSVLEAGSIGLMKMQASAHQAQGDGRDVMGA